VAKAIAASVWFQGSAWPPSNHGIIPLGSWRAAMALAVIANSSAVMTPGISGSNTFGTFGFAGVLDEALAQYRVEYLVGPGG